MAETFAIAPARRRAKAFSALAGAVASGLLGTAFFGGLGWFWGVLAALTAIFTVAKLVSINRMTYVAKVETGGVTVCLPSGREIQTKWDDIEAHTIASGRRLGGLVVRAGSGGEVRVIPVAIGDMDKGGAERFLAALKEHRPKLEYRVPEMRAGKK